MNPAQIPFVRVNEEKFISKSELLSLLKTYNCYHEGKSFQLRLREEGGELIMEGLLNISWGLRRPIRLQMQDDHERFHFASAGLWRPESQGRDHRNENQQSPIQLSFESNNNEVTVPAKTSVDGVSSEEETPQIPRTRSDASFMNVLRRSKQRSPGDLQRVKRHRFSINGHFYNHKTSIFTPAYGSVTNVRVSSSMTTQQVLSLLLNKFRVQNKADEFALYVVHESGERTKIKDTEYPLVSRVLHGPCEKIAKIFIMEKDLGEEVTYDVAQYIKFEMPVLNQFVTKLREEEEREISKLTEKYGVLKSMILQQLKDDSESPDGV
ncbi:ras association domain-containing protein 4a isoform X1 [Neoarius graeffei]|uniref:ras association domain-containing protein 4a isoform X1 n=2 Tax=Neoarius graeffei TaxID=443677 RepID=UPI00298C5D9D|nr:ras association domain-containing protein 4a isoform X1 [Neoarius graeffei]XP_060781923.1 ras association domain-containing protein 4a isoform X1 [Neoarius graeffei]XP_060781924.1 ras association domain-containing protein 4a isoform X1 [Neoarius graeffei]